jgi:nitrite reductase/ring-hydroxylating ferredoxin subunit
MTSAWVANGLSQDLPHGVVMQGAWGEQDLAIWRSASGRIAAWKDRCPHRGMRLSHGFVRGETLSCIYHGWVYGTSGACSRIPAHPDLVPPSAIRATEFACIEADGVIWVAPAGTEAAVPDLSGFRPVRSLTFTAPVVVEGFTGEGVLRGSVVLGGRQVALCLVLQALASGHTTVHALCDAAGDRVAVSRWLEALRWQVEKGAAA